MKEEEENGIKWSKNERGEREKMKGREGKTGKKARHISHLVSQLTAFNFGGKVK